MKNGKKKRAGANPAETAADQDPPACSSCDATLKMVSYTIWGTKRFDSTTNSYQEDDSPGNTDMEFTCPSCSAKIDPEAIIF